MLGVSSVDITLARPAESNVCCERKASCKYTNGFPSWLCIRLLLLFRFIKWDHSQENECLPCTDTYLTDFRTKRTPQLGKGYRVLYKCYPRACVSNTLPLGFEQQCSVVCWNPFSGKLGTKEMHCSEAETSAKDCDDLLAGCLKRFMIKLWLPVMRCGPGSQLSFEHWAPRFWQRKQYINWKTPWLHLSEFTSSGHLFAMCQLPPK